MTDGTWFGHPRGLSTLFFTEMWERFSYYGMRAILVLFMTNAVATGGLGLDDVTATAIYGLVYGRSVCRDAAGRLGCGSTPRAAPLGLLGRGRHRGGPLHARNSVDADVLCGPQPDRDRHRPAEAECQRDGRRSVSRRRRAA